MVFTIINKTPEKCSAVSTMERSMPTEDYSHLVQQLRALITTDIQANPGLYSQEDIDSAYNDDWFLSRYLLRVHLDLKSAHTMLRKSMKFRNGPTMRITEFPAEFYLVGALFSYEPDRKGNLPVYMRIRMHQNIARLQEFLKAFLFRQIEETDKLAGGKGIALVFDLQGASYQNMDMDTLFFVITTLVNYFPKGLSYMLVHELPWYFRSFWHIAKQWLSEDHKDLVKFSDARTIYEYFNEDKLPDFMGGTCKRDYCKPPDNCVPLVDAARRWGVEESEANRIKARFNQYLPKEARVPDAEVPDSPINERKTVLV